MSTIDGTFHRAFDSYLEAFSKPSPVEQERLLRIGVADEVIFTNPGVAGRGRADLIDHIALFRGRFPGDHFEIRWVRQQHRQLLVEWIQFGADGSEVVTGHGFARVDEEDRLALIAGFCAPGAA